MPVVGLAGLEVGLVAGDDEVLLVDDLGAVLDAGVAADDLVLEGELEVADLAALPDEEGVALGRLLLGRAAGDAAVLDVTRSRGPSSRPGPCR